MYKTIWTMFLFIMFVVSHFKKDVNDSLFWGILLLINTITTFGMDK